MTETSAATDRGWLGRVERLGNRLPDPVVIFLVLIGLLVAFSVWADWRGWSAVNPATGEELRSQSLLTAENVARLLVEMPATLTGFPPLGLVLVVMLGAAVAERSGLFAALIGRAMRNRSGRFLTPIVFVTGVMSHHASDAAYIVLIPLAAFIYAEAGRHPLAGAAAAYAGISGAFAGNYLPGQFDVLMLGITNASARLLAPDYVLNPLGNWWFTLAIGLAFIPIAWFVTDRIVEPRLGRWDRAGTPLALSEEAAAAASADGAALRNAGFVALAVVLVFAALALVPGYTPLVDETAEGPGRYTPLYRALVAGFFLLFLLTGWAYGRKAGTIRGHRDVVSMMAGGMRAMAPYLVIVFFAAHFVTMFAWSNLGPVIAIGGAEWLRSLMLPHAVMLLMLLLVAAFFDIFIGSASAKWTAMAPLVVPMLMLLGISPEMATAAYRMGDSIFNIITPVATNFPLVLVICQRWSKDFGVGSLIALMLPYSIAFAIGGLSLLVAWSSAGLPVGPAAPYAYELPQ